MTYSFFYFSLAKMVDRANLFPPNFNIHVAAFEAAMEYALAQLDLAQAMRRCTGKMDSPYIFVRMDGLHASLGWLSRIATSCSSTLPTGKGALEVVDMIGASLLSTSSAGSSRGFLTWMWVQKALQFNLVSVVFRYILARRDLLMGNTAPPQMTHEEALEWTTIAACRNPILREQAAPSASLSLYAMHDSSSTEQELALRYLQGLCLVLPHQKQYVVDGCPLLPLFHHVMCGFLQHVQALHRDGEQRAEETDVSDPLQLPSGAGQEKALSRAAVHPTTQSVIIAFVDAVEASCHYNPRGLAALVSVGAVRSMILVALCRWAPTDVRCAILDTVSVLMQEVAPFRRAVQRGADAGEIPTLVQAMLDQGVGERDPELPPTSATPLYMMDRASASKFDSAVRDVFSQQKLSSVVGRVLAVRDVAGVAIPSALPRQEAVRLAQRLNRQREKMFADLLHHIDHADLTE
jgi:hypothetical protein